MIVYKFVKLKDYLMHFKKNNQKNIYDEVIAFDFISKFVMTYFFCHSDC